MTNIHRLRDLSDVIELIKALKLEQEFGLRLNPFVRGKYEELWRGSRTRYVRIVEGINTGIHSIDDLVAAGDSLEYRAMRDDGMAIEVRNDAVWLVTSDPVIAEKYAMHEESELWDGGR